MQSKFAQHVKDQENINLCEKAINRCKIQMTQMLELPNKDFKANIKKVF